jgi:hypothetical protein
VRRRTCGTNAGYRQHQKHGEVACDPCRRAHAEYARGYRARYPERIRKTNQRTWGKYFRKYRFRAFERRYRLNPSQYAELFEESDGLCALCYEKPAIVVDHAHGTGEIRGALCGLCNRHLGHFHDDPREVYRALEYLLYPPHRNPT